MRNIKNLKHKETIPTDTKEIKRNLRHHFAQLYK